MALLVSDRSGSVSFVEKLLTLMKKKKTSEEARQLIDAQAKQTNLRELVDSKGLSLLHHAALRNCTTVAKYLLDNGCNVDAVDHSGNTPLMLAVAKSAQKTCSVLLQANANIYLVNNAGEHRGRSIVTSVLRSTRYAIIKIFLRHIQATFSRDVNRLAHVLKQVQCPLFIATFLERADLIEAMLKINVEANDTCEQQFDKTALHAAVEQGDVDMVRLLIEHGAYTNARESKNNETPLFKYMELEYRTGRVPHGILQHFLREGVDLMVENKLGEILLFNLLEEVDKESAQMLSPHIDFDTEDGEKKTALHCLSINFAAGVIDVAANRKFHVNAQDFDGRTPLMLAVQFNIFRNVKFLLDNGADIAMTDNKGQTALTHAFTSSVKIIDHLVEIVELLLYLGADVQKIYNGTKTIFDVNFATQPNLKKIIAPAVAHLALLKKSLTPIIDCVQNAFASKEELRNIFRKCESQFEKLKNVRIISGVTLYTLLTGTPHCISYYKRNPNFTANLELAIKEYKRVMDPYYLHVIQRRVSMN